MSAPRVHRRLCDGGAQFWVDGRPHAELFIKGDEDRLEYIHGILLRMVETAYLAGRSEAKAEIRSALGFT